MGTRSLTVLQDNDGQEIAVLYRQMDGYPSGHGADLAKYLKPFTVVNGFGLGAKRGKVASGMSCLAAQLVAKFKQEVGHFYLYPAGTRDCDEEYVYTVGVQAGQVHLECRTAGYGGEPGHLLYSGPAAEWKTQAVEAAEQLLSAEVR